MRQKIRGETGKMIGIGYVEIFIEEFLECHKKSEITTQNFDLNQLKKSFK